MAADPAEGGFRGDGAVIATSGALFVVGIALLAAGVWVELPGPLAAYSDPTASWPIGVQVVLGTVALTCWWWVNRRRSRAFTVVLLSLGIGCVVMLGVASYSRCPQDGQSAVWSVVSSVLGLVVNNYPTENFSQGSCQLGAPPLALQTAHLAQLVVLLVAATSAIRALLRGQLDRLLVRFSPRVFLVLAVDASAVTLLPALTAGARGWTRAIVTKDPNAPWLSPARVAGWRIVSGDPEAPGVLRTLLARPGGRHALRGLAVLSPDSVETQRLMGAADAAIRGRHGGLVRALLRIDDAWQAEDWRRRYLAQPGRWAVDTISEYEVTARLLVLDTRARGAETVVVVGRSGLTFALLAEIALQAREAALVGGPEAPPGLVLVDPLAQRVWDEHLLAERGFGMAAQAEADVRDAEDLESVLAGLADPDRVAVIFAGDVDDEDQRLASRLGVLHPSMVIYSRRAEVSGVGGTPLLAQVVAFGLTLDAGAGRPVDRWERMARLAHEAYVRAHPDPGNPGRLPWDGGLSQFHRESNVRQVITTLGAAVEVGRSWGTSTGATGQATQPSAAQLERMAELEHQSWREHQTEHGRSHADLVPWEQLDESSRVKTRDGVLEALELLATLGYRSFDDPEVGWREFRRRGVVTAVRRHEDWHWTSAGGDEMRGRAGDWEVTDAGGTRSVSASTFPATHEHAEGDTYRRVGSVEARRARPGEVVVSPEGAATADVGQWVLRDSSGEWLVSDSHLGSAYALADDQSRQ